MLVQKQAGAIVSAGLVLLNLAMSGVRFDRLPMSSTFKPVSERNGKAAGMIIG